MTFRMGFDYLGREDGGSEFLLNGGNFTSDTVPHLRRIETSREQVFIV